MLKEEIIIKDEEQVRKMLRAGNIVAKCHAALKTYLQPGLSLIEVDEYVNNIIEANGAKSIIKDYDGFPRYNCISVNDCIVHGIADETKLQEGDIVGIDISVIIDGYVADSCWSYGIGQISAKDEALLYHTEQALYKGLEKVKHGDKLGNVSFAIEKYAKRNNLGIVKELAGHGVGTSLHEEPMVPNYGKKGRGVLMKEGMTLAIEPMLNAGKADIYLKPDNWSVMTYDQSNSAHFEHTIVVTKSGHEIITIERTEEEIANFKF